MQGNIFRILQLFAPKLCISTNFGILFNAVIMNYTISKILKILSITQIQFRPVSVLEKRMRTRAAKTKWRASRVHDSKYGSKAKVSFRPGSM
jgi:hypothetical protein